MLISLVPDICSARILGGFGYVAVGPYGTKDQKAPALYDEYKDFIFGCQEALLQYKFSYGSNKHNLISNQAMILAACVDGQEVVEKHLLKLGFTLSLDVPEYGKYPHGIRFYMMPANEFHNKVTNYKEN